MLLFWTYLAAEGYFKPKVCLAAEGYFAPKVRLAISDWF